MINLQFHPLSPTTSPNLCWLIQARKVAKNLGCLYTLLKRNTLQTLGNTSGYSPQSSRIGQSIPPKEALKIINNSSRAELFFNQRCYYEYSQKTMTRAGQCTLKKTGNERPHMPQMQQEGSSSKCHNLPHPLAVSKFADNLDCMNVNNQSVQ